MVDCWVAMMVDLSAVMTDAYLAASMAVHWAGTMVGCWVEMSDRLWVVMMVDLLAVHLVL